MKVTEAKFFWPLRFALLSLMLFGLGACAQVSPSPIARQELAANLAPLTKMERRAEQVKFYSVLLNNAGGIGETDAAALKDHYDIYYVYYLAATTHLGRGNLDAYRAHTKLAEKELDSMEAILKKTLATFGPQGLEPPNQFSRFGL